MADAQVTILQLQGEVRDLRSQVLLLHADNEALTNKDHTELVFTISSVSPIEGLVDAAHTVGGEGENGDRGDVAKDRDGEERDEIRSMRLFVEDLLKSRQELQQRLQVKEEEGIRAVQTRLLESKALKEALISKTDEITLLDKRVKELFHRSHTLEAVRDRLMVEVAALEESSRDEAATFAAMLNSREKLNDQLLKQSKEELDRVNSLNMEAAAYMTGRLQEVVQSRDDLQTQVHTPIHPYNTSYTPITRLTPS